MSAVTQDTSADWLGQQVGHQVARTLATPSRRTSSSTATPGPGFRPTTPLTSPRTTSRRLRGLGDPIDLAEVDDVYLPLSRLLNLYVGATAACTTSTSDVPREDAAADPVRHRGRRVGRGRQVHDRRACCASCSPAGRTPRASSSSPRTASSTRTPSCERRGLMDAQGLPRVLRPPRADAVRGRRSRPGVPEVTAPVYSHLTYDIVPDDRDRRAQPRRPHRRGPQRAAAARARYDGTRRRRGQRLLRLLDLRRRRGAGRASAGTSSGSSASGRPRSPTRTRTSTGTPRSPTRRRRPRPLGSGTRSTRRTSWTTSCRRGPAPPWSSPRARTTAWRRSGSASSEPLRRQRLSGSEAQYQPVDCECAQAPQGVP